MSSFLRLTRACLRRRVRSGHNRTSHRKAMALILSARFFLSNQRHCRWLVAGKDGGEKGRWVTFDAYRFCIQARSGYDRTHIAPTHFTRVLLRAARHIGIRSDSSCSFIGAENPYLPTKFVRQYGFALDFQSARERSRKTKAVFFVMLSFSEKRERKYEALFFRISFSAEDHSQRLPQESALHRRSHPRSAVPAKPAQTEAAQ